jgi:hypothetical protein
MSDIEGKATRVGASERGKRASFKRRNQVQDFPAFLGESLGSATRFTSPTACRFLFQFALQE